MKVVHHHNPEHAAETHRKATINTMVATGLTFAAVLALWLLLLPQLYKDGLPDAKVPTWFRTDADPNSSFGQALLESRTALDALQEELTEANTRQTTSSEAEKLRQKIGEPPESQNPVEPQTP